MKTFIFHGWIAAQACLLFFHLVDEALCDKHHDDEYDNGHDNPDRLHRNVDAKQCHSGYPFAQARSARDSLFKSSAHGSANSLFAQACFQSVVDYFKSLYPCVTLVIALEQYPGGERC